MLLTSLCEPGASSSTLVALARPMIFSWVSAGSRSQASMSCRYFCTTAYEPPRKPGSSSPTSAASTASDPPIAGVRHRSHAAPHRNDGLAEGQPALP